jgi:hypothetical protein
MKQCNQQVNVIKGINPGRDMVLLDSADVTFFMVEKSEVQSDFMNLSII